MKKSEPKKKMFQQPPIYAAPNMANYVASPAGFDPYLLNYQPPNSQPWAQSIPTTMPWAAQAQLEPMVRFTAQNQLYAQSPPLSTIPTTPAANSFSPLQPNGSIVTPTPTAWSNGCAGGSRFGGKRRNESSSDEDSDDGIMAPPAKITLTEQRVMGRFNRMNLDAAHSDDSLDAEELPMINDNYITDPNSAGSLEISNELCKALNAERQCPVEKLLKDELARSTMAIVPWTPLPSHLITGQTADEETVQVITIVETPNPSDSEDDKLGITIEEIFDDDSMDTV